MTASKELLQFALDKIDGKPGKVTASDYNTRLTRSTDYTLLYKEL